MAQENNRGPEEPIAGDLNASADIEEEIAATESKLNNARSRAKTRPAIWALAMIALGIFLLVGRGLFPPDFVYAKYLPLAGLALIGYGVVGGLFLLVSTQSRVASFQADLDALNARKRVLNRFAQTTGAPSEQYFDSLVRINVENLAAYYALVKVHTDKSFLVSIAVGIVGFVFIIAGLLVGFTDKQNAKALSYIATGSGVVTEFIAGVFFYLYNRTVRQMKEYHDSLLSVQNILLSFKIVGDTRDDSEKVKMISSMLTYLIGQRSDPDVMPKPSAEAPKRNK